MTASSLNAMVTAATAAAALLVAAVVSAAPVLNSNTWKDDAGQGCADLTDTWCQSYGTERFPSQVDGASASACDVGCPSCSAACGGSSDPSPSAPPTDSNADAANAGGAALRGTPATAWILGDSLGSFSQNQLAQECKGSTVINAAEGGTTAAQWGDGSSGLWTDGVAALEGSTPTHVWLSVGGNDFLGRGCRTSDMPDITNKVGVAIQNTLAKIPADAKVLLTGYGASDPSSEGETCRQAGASGLLALNGAIKAAASKFDSNRVSYINIYPALGGSSSTLSDAKYFLSDGIHPNSAGYKVIFGISAIQTFFQCSGASPAAGSVGNNSGDTNVKPAVEFVTVTGLKKAGTPGENDEHAVHAAELPANANGGPGYSVAGKYISGKESAFLMRMDAKGQLMWEYTVDNKGRDWFLSSVGSVDGKHVYAAGAVSPTSTFQRTIVKLNAATGAPVWSKVWPKSTAGGLDAFEAVDSTADGGLVACGTVGATEIFGFKSAGNVEAGGKAVVVKMSAEQLKSASMLAFEWTVEVPNGLTCKSFDFGGEGGSIVVALSSNVVEGERPIVTAINAASGEVIKSVVLTGGSPHEGTDIAVSPVDGSIAITGHGSNPNNGGTTDGAVTKLTAEGDTLWTKWYGNPDGGKGAFANLPAKNPKIVYDECWGIAATADGGFAVGCGTGVHGCPNDGENIKLPSGVKQSECGPSDTLLWRHMVVKIDANGAEQWMAVDAAHDYVAGSPKHDSASEYVVVTRDGGIVSLGDEGGFGVGLIKYTAGGNAYVATENNDGDEDGGVPDSAARPSSGSARAGALFVTAAAMVAAVFNV